MKGKKEWTDRQTVCLIQQWKDNKPVTTIHSANEFGMVERKVKLNDRWDKVEVRRPKAIDTYNQYMNGVDRSDQILAKNNTLRKCMRWWKTLFFHLIDIAVVNSFILFQLYRSQNKKDVEELQRPKRYCVLEFRGAGKTVFWVGRIWCTTGGNLPLLL